MHLEMMGEAIAPPCENVTATLNIHTDDQRAAVSALVVGYDDVSRLWSIAYQLGGEQTDCTFCSQWAIEKHVGSAVERSIYVLSRKIGA